MKKKMPFGLIIISIIIVLFEIWYYSPLLLGTYQMMDTLYEISTWSLFVYFNILLSLIAIFSVTYGFYKARNWSRLYIIFYLSYSSFWAIIMMFILRPSDNVINTRYLFFVFYVIIICYLLMSWVKDYFKQMRSEEEFLIEKPRYYKYGDYTLYKNEVETKKGKTRVYYFFCKSASDKGRPCSLPDEYTVGINKKTGVPYIKKKK